MATKKTPRWMKLLVLAGVIVVLWAAAFRLIMGAVGVGGPARPLPSFGDMANVLFGASSLALIMFSVLVGALAVVGWESLKTNVRRDVETATHGRITALENELQGRVLSIIGFMIGALHSNSDKLEQDEHKDYLSEAVLYCEQGYDILKGVEGRGRHMALNNLVYYTCLYNQGTAAKREDLLKQARALKATGDELDAPNLLLTYCRAVLQYGSAEERSKALKVAEKLLLRDSLTNLQKREATFYVASLSEQPPVRPGQAAR